MYECEIEKLNKLEDKILEDRLQRIKKKMQEEAYIEHCKYIAKSIERLGVFTEWGGDLIMEAVDALIEVFPILDSELDEDRWRESHRCIKILVNCNVNDTFNICDNPFKPDGLVDKTIQKLYSNLICLPFKGNNNG